MLPCGTPEVTAYSALQVGCQKKTDRVHLVVCNVHVHCINHNVGDKPLVVICNVIQNHKVYPVYFLLTTYLQSAVPI